MIVKSFFRTLSNGRRMLMCYQDAYECRWQ